MILTTAIVVFAYFSAILTRLLLFVVQKYVQNLK